MPKSYNKRYLEHKRRKESRLTIYILLGIIAIGLAVFFVVAQSGRGTNATSQGDLSNKPQAVSPDERLSFETAVGKPAPNFTLEGIDGKMVKLSDFRGKKVVLFFTEGAMCYPACWNQMTAFGNDKRFNTSNVVVFSILNDYRSDWERIISEVPEFSNTRFLFDTTKDVSNAYDVLYLPSSMHRGTNPGHTYFIIDELGTVRYTLDDPDMAVQNDVLANELARM